MDVFRTAGQMNLKWAGQTRLYGDVHDTILKWRQTKRRCCLCLSVRSCFKLCANDGGLGMQHVQREPDMRARPGQGEQAVQREPMWESQGEPHVR